jgi:hypothetical protein
MSSLGNIDNLPDSFNEIYQQVLLPADIQITSVPCRENESREYEAMQFKLNGKLILFRQAKITPRKTGQFVTLWKRPSPDAAIMPFVLKDNIDFCLIATDSENKKGFFLFDLNILIEKGIFSNEINTGKRGIRIYPVWDFPTSKQAIQTQKWQSHYFINLANSLAAREKFKNIFSEFI